ncbi:MAG: DUF1501 domain-containing protein [Planctomycetaceae bacterium]
MKHGGFQQQVAEIDRRRFLQSGVAGIGGLSLAQLLRSESEVRSSTSPPARAKSCIFVILSGGPGQHETFDPKPNAPREIRGLYEAIATQTPGVQLSEMLPQLAARSNRYCLLRSMSHEDAVHVTAVHTMLTGQRDGSRSNESPFMGSLISKFRPSEAMVPSYVWLHNMKTGTNKVPRYESGLHLLGHQYAPFRVGYELDNPTSPNFRVSDFDPPSGLSLTEVEHRRRLLSSLDRNSSGELTPPFEQYDKYQHKAWELMTGPAARRAFELSHESNALRDRYGRHPLGQYCLMARRLIESGVRLVTVTGWPGLAPGETVPTVTQVWDSHDNYYEDGDSMYGNGPYGLKWALPRLDQALAALLDDMRDRGLFEETLVVVVGEFGRTPKFGETGRGREHWPHCYTALLAGAGIRGGMVYGESDRDGAYVASGRPISHIDFAATLFDTLGIPPETRYGPDGFSFKVNEGQPLHEIFG